VIPVISYGHTGQDASADSPDASDNNDSEEYVAGAADRASGEHAEILKENRNFG
jgi:hypothetical protein